MKRLLTIGHSYVVAMNRRLAHEMALAGAGEWEVTCVAPLRYPGDLRDIELEHIDDEACRTVAVVMQLARTPHLMRYHPDVRRVFAEVWDVVHCWEEPYVRSAWQVARATPRSAALVYATFQNLPKRYPPPFAQMERRVMRRADGWIAFGRTVEETLVDRPGYRDRPHAVIPPGVDVARFRPDPRERRVQREFLERWPEDGPPVVGYLGRFTPAKGLRVLMAALERTRNPWRAWFVGGGEMEDELSAWADRAPHPARVSTGAPHDAVPGILNAMDLLVAPSLTTPRWREQFGRMLTEAMACGVAVIGSDSGEIPHVLGDAGAVVPEGDADALAAAIDRWLADPPARAEAARRGLERARTEFALSAVARRHLQFFDQLLDRKPTRRSGDTER